MANIPKKYDFAVIATDVVIFSVINNELNVLLIKMKKQPYTQHWALPGGLVKPEEDLDNAANRILNDKAGLSQVYLEQLYTFGRVNRDPFGRVVSVAYFALIPHNKAKIKTTEEYAGIQWFPIKKLPLLAYDHKEIVTVAVERLQAKLEYTNIVYGLLPEEFTLSELQYMYEIVLDRRLDKRNFRKKIISLKLVKKLNRKKHDGPNRPAELYKFVDRQPHIVEII